MSIDAIKMWHERARPRPTEANFNVQLGCHFEEIGEMLESMAAVTHDEDVVLIDMAIANINQIAERLKSGAMRIAVIDRKEMLDALADQIVTATGVGHCAGMNISEAVRRVNHSNWTKYDPDGHPIFSPEGKIVKGPNYHPPVLNGLY